VVPGQLIIPALHVHVFPEQISPGAHWLPHAPQLSASVATSTQEPPAVHCMVQTQLPFVHTVFGPQA
jgi:hypothetical protein